MIAPGDVQSLLTDLRSQGWSIEQTERHHYKCTPPQSDKQIVVISRLNEPRAWRNAMANLRRSGYEETRKQVGNGNRAKPAHHVREEPIPVLPPLAASLEVLRDEYAQLERESLDSLFTKLRDAKELDALACEEVSRATRVLNEAAQRLDECRRAQDGTRKELQEAKKAFDLAFGG